MNIADGVAFTLILVGSVGLLFVVFLRIYNKLLKQYYVHWEDEDGDQSYSIVKACSKKGAALKLYDSSLVEVWVTKVVRYEDYISR